MHSEDIMATYYEVSSQCTTLSYKRLINDKEVLLDFYPPSISTSGSASTIRIETIPAIVFFHAGGLMMGNRRFGFPAWLQSMLLHTSVPKPIELDFLVG